MRSGQTYCGVPLMGDASGSAESLKLTIPKYVMPSRCKRSRLRLRERYLTRLQAIPILRFRGYICHGAPAAGRSATLNGRCPKASTLQILNSVAANRNPFAERTKPMIAVIHSRSQKRRCTGISANRCADSTAHYLATDSGQLLSAPELTHAIRTTNADIIPLIRGGEVASSSVFSRIPTSCARSEKRGYRVAGIGYSGNSTALDLLSDFAAIHRPRQVLTSRTRCAHVGTHNNTSRNCEHRTTSCVCSCVRCRCTTLHKH